MVAAKTAFIFLVAVLGELSGVYAIWRWRRQAGPAWWRARLRAHFANRHDGSGLLSALCLGTGGVRRNQ